MLVGWYWDNLQFGKSRVNICIYIYVYIYVYIYMYIHVCVCVFACCLGDKSRISKQIGERIKNAEDIWGYMASNTGDVTDWLTGGVNHSLGMGWNHRAQNCVTSFARSLHWPAHRFSTCLGSEKMMKYMSQYAPVDFPKWFISHLLLNIVYIYNIYIYVYVHIIDIHM